MGDYNAVFAYDLRDDAPIHCGGPDKGLIRVLANETIVVPAEASIVFYTGLKLKPGNLDNVQLDPEELTYHWSNYESSDYSVELYADEGAMMPDSIGHRIALDREILLKITNHEDVERRIEINGILGRIYAVMRIYRTWNTHFLKSGQYKLGSSSHQTSRAYTINSDTRRVFDKETQ
jgi:hypothetical protein